MFVIGLAEGLEGCKDILATEGEWLHADLVAGVARVFPVRVGMRDINARLRRVVYIWVRSRGLCNADEQDGGCDGEREGVHRGER